MQWRRAELLWILGSVAAIRPGLPPLTFRKVLQWTLRLCAFLPTTHGSGGAGMSLRVLHAKQCHAFMDEFRFSYTREINEDAVLFF